MLKWNNPEKYVRELAASRATEIAEEIKFDVIGESFKPKSGRRYGAHVASALGEAFASKTERLIKNIEITPPDISGNKVTVYVGVSNVPYAALLERPDKLNRPVWGRAAGRARRRFDRRRR